MTKIRWVLACCGIWGLCSLVFVSANASVSIRTNSVEESFSVLTLLDTSSGRAKNPNANDTHADNTKEGDENEETQQQLIEWNVQTLLYYLDNLYLQRQRKDNQGIQRPSSSYPSLTTSVVEQVRAYVSSIASLYRPQNSFHNFEHATHVTRAMHHVLSSLNEDSSTHLQPHMQIIRQDALLQVALILAALVHDVDHSGVPNTQRILEEPHLVLEQNNNNQSIAERHSLHVAWQLLKGSEFDQFRGLLLLDEQPHDFYHWIETAVMATDIADADLRTDRQRRWDITFGATLGAATTNSSSNKHDNNKEDIKVTIAMEHLMQIADIAHTMNIVNADQDDNNATTTNIFRKWNQRLFAELHQGYRDRRSEKDPKQGWYQGEIGFFDYYIIPLAQRWELCSAGGEDDASLVTRARHNREEWIRNGQQFVETLVEFYSARTGQYN